MKTMRGDIKTIVTIVSSLVLRRRRRKRVGKRVQWSFPSVFFGGYFNYSLVLKISRYVQYRYNHWIKKKKEEESPGLNFLTYTVRVIFL